MAGVGECGEEQCNAMRKTIVQERKERNINATLKCYMGLIYKF